MFKRLLVPLDGSQLAEDAVVAAAAVARLFDAHITLLHIVEPAPHPTVHGQPHLMSAPAASTYLQDLAVRLRAQGLQVSPDVQETGQAGVAACILARALELDADLVVLCTHGSTGLREILFGSIAQQVLQAGTIPVLLLRPIPGSPRAALPLAHFLVPLDGRAIYEPAILAARDLAGAARASLTLVVVVPTLKTLSPERAAAGALLPRSTQAVLELAERGAVEYLEKKLRELAAAGVQARGSVIRGEIVPEVLQAAGSSTDLIIMATHGRAGIAAFWSGSVAPKVLQHTRVPVLLLRVAGPEPVR